MKKEYYQDYSYIIEIDSKVVARIDFPLLENDNIVITHTFVDDSLRGQGIASYLVGKVISFVKEKNYSIKAECSYAVHYFEKNNIKEYRGIYDKSHK